MSILISLVAGIVAGILLTGAVVLWMMRTRMVVAHRSRRSFEETCSAIERTVRAHRGWGFPIDSWNFYETFRKKNQIPKHIEKLKVYFVCNSALAQKVISANPAMAGIMPCSWAVYELDDGSVHLAKMNIGMMSRMFSGVIGENMGIVAEADERFLAIVLGEKELDEPEGDAPGTVLPEPAGVQFDRE